MSTLEAEQIEQMTSEERCLHIDGLTPEGGLYNDAQRPVHPDANSSWQVGPTAWKLPTPVLDHLEALGGHLLKFYRALNLLYNQSWRGTQPAWVADYMDRGKPESVVALGRMNRFRQHLPGVIRPDLIPTREGMIATELDSLPGGIGFTGSLGQRYSSLGDAIVGGPDGMIAGYGDMLEHTAGSENPVIAVVVSEESAGWRPEMEWMAAQLRDRGMDISVMRSDDVIFTEDGLFCDADGPRRKIDLIYRFFELFDLKNIPKMDLILYAAKKNQVKVSPPLKSYLEEKMGMGLLRHPALQVFWQEHLGEASLTFLDAAFPHTWILDPAPLPPYGVIPDLTFRGLQFSDWRQLATLGQKERQLVIKPSGFSELAWGSRGVAIGHDMSESDWATVIDEALAAFDETPHILQRFHNGSTFPVEYYDFGTASMKGFKGRVRLQPYYFVVGDEARLSGVQATVCPPDKKLLHGMVDAVVLPCGQAR